MSICVSIKTTCPYCGLENILNLSIDSQIIPKQIVTCDVARGGCDKDFVVDPHFKITSDVYKIEGIEKIWP
jgi:hypothetical protein